MNKYTEEQRKFLIENNYMKPAKELANLFNTRFNMKITAKEIKSFRGNNKLNSGLTGRFEKGHIPVNKGTKGMFNVGGNKTSYQKGNKSWNCDPIGTEKWKSCTKRHDEGFLYVKVQDGHKQHNWKQKHRLLWEEAYGKIPEGYKVIFKDGNRHNIVLENLALVSNSQMLILNKHNLIFSDSKLTETGINIAKVIDVYNEKTRK